MHRSRHTKHRLLYLLASILLLVVLYPYLQGGLIRTSLLNVLISAVLITSTYVLSYDKKPFIIAILLGVPAILTTWASMFYHTYTYASYVFTIAFYFFTLFTILAYVLRAERITIEQIYGAVCVYLLIGIVWGSLFFVTESLHPGSFSVQFERPLIWSDFMYFSFMTLTTVGYGDIVPVTPRAQSLSILEGTIGVLYIALLVARLVSLYTHYIALDNHRKRMKKS